MLEIIDYTNELAEKASALAKAYYDGERAAVPVLPELPRFKAAELQGVAAVEGGELKGFLCFYPPRDNAFTTSSRGSYSPMHAHGVVKDNRAYITSRLYQAAAVKLVSLGSLCHSITLYAHDAVSLDTFFKLGFGMRCVDAIKSIDRIPVSGECRYSLRVLGDGEAPLVRELRQRLNKHLGNSPCFMCFTDDECSKWLEHAEKRGTKLFTAFDSGRAIAFIEVGDDGENVATEAPDMKNICGAYCLPECRGAGLMPHVINLAVDYFAARGIKRLGVDFESINPTANAFWLKYFKAYTYSLVRRIDESALTAK